MINALVNTNLFSYWLFVCLICTNSGLAQGSWELIEPTDKENYLPKDEASMAMIGDKIYLIGGRGRKPTNIYDLATNTWKTTKRPPVEMHHFQAITFNNKIYIVGAFTGGYPSETPLPNIYTYDPADDSWSLGPQIPANRLRGACGVTVYNDKFYLVSGITDGHRSGHVSWFDEFDPKTEKWRALQDTPRPRDHVQVAVIDHKLYVAGGRNSKAPDSTFTQTISELDIYDFKRKSWTTFTDPIPTERAGNSTISLGQYLVVIGGESGSSAQAHKETEAFDTKTKKWVSLAGLNEGRHGLGAVSNGKKIYVAGGNGNRGAGKPLQSL